MSYELQPLILVKHSYKVAEGRVKGIRLVYDPEVNSKISNRCFNYWKRCWPNRVIDNEVVIKTKFSGQNVSWRFAYNGKLFTFDVYNHWLSNRSIKGEQAIRNCLTDIDFKIFLKTVLRDQFSILWPTFSVLPSNTENALDISMTQLALFYKERSEFVTAIKKGTPYDVEKLRHFIETLMPMRIALT